MKKSNKKLTTEEFILRARQVHGDRYDYSLAEYTNSNNKVKIICPDHGVFEQVPYSHLKGHSCVLCKGDRISISKKSLYDINDFITNAKQVHVDKYDYSQVEYINANTNVDVVCLKHNHMFSVSPGNHIHQSIGCPKCYEEYRVTQPTNNKKRTLEDFINLSIELHGDKYSYDLVEYKNNHTKVKIVCPIHGVFEQTPIQHLNGRGCRECSYINKSIDIQEFIDRSNLIHGGIYSYDLVEYKNGVSKVKIICPIHGVFKQMPYLHLQGQGCKKCAISKYAGDEQDFITKAKQVHGDRYSYDLVEYINCRTKIKIVCPVHGVFEQRIDSHLGGSGCPVCSKIVSNQEIEFVEYIKSLYDGSIITNTRSVIPPYELDVYLPDLQVAFEYNGTYWHNEGINKPVGYHQMKTDMCMDKGVELHHIWENDWVGDNNQIKECVGNIVNKKP